MVNMLYLIYLFHISTKYTFKTLSFEKIEAERYDHLVLCFNTDMTTHGSLYNTDRYNTDSFISRVNLGSQNLKTSKVYLWNLEKYFSYLKIIRSDYSNLVYVHNPVNLITFRAIFSQGWLNLKTLSPITWVSHVAPENSVIKGFVCITNADVRFVNSDITITYYYHSS